jgi:hypothetical protein
LCRIVAKKQHACDVITFYSPEAVIMTSEDFYLHVWAASSQPLASGTHYSAAEGCSAGFLRHTRTQELGTLLGVTPEKAESIAADMMNDGRLSGHIDQVRM